jgi:parvulin-like peptidyl-prolyl isomerase
METLRKQMKTVLWIVVIAFVATIFYFWGAGGRLGKNPNVVAIVNGEEISIQEYNQEYQKARDRLGPNVNLEYLQQHIISNLIAEKLLLQYAKKMKIEATEEEIENVIKSQFLTKEGSFDAVRYREVLKSIPERRWLEIESSIRKQLLIQKLSNLITSGVKVAEEEIKEEYKRENELRKIKYIKLNIKATEEEEKSVRKRAEDVLNRIKSGEDFAKLAKEFSEDTTTKDKGGDLDFVKEENLIKGLKEGVKALKKPNEISNIIKSELGLHIVKLWERKGNEVHISHIFFRLEPSEETRMKLREKIQEIHRKIKEKNIEFEKVSNEVDELKTTEFFTRNPKDEEIRKIFKDIEDARLLINSSFSIPLNEVSEPIFGRKGNYIIKVIDKKDADESLYLTKREECLKKAIQEKESQMFNHWLYSLYSTSKINVFLKKEE